MNSIKNYTNTGAYLRKLYDSLVASLHQQLGNEGYSEITPSHGLVFQYLDEEGSRITTLAAQACMTKQSMSALVYQLEGYGYVQRKADPYDGRAILFVLTAKGEILKTKAQQVNYQFERSWEQRLGSKQYHTLRMMLQKLAENEAKTSVDDPQG